jgi:hypothetical protein
MVLVFYSISNSQASNKFAEELRRIDVDTVCVVQSQAIDEFPLWSQQGDYIGVNISGKWYKVNLNKIRLERSTWRRQKQPIGVAINGLSLLEEVSQGEVEAFKKVSKLNPRSINTKDGISVELRSQGFETAFIIKKKGEKAKLLWTTEMENCHSLVLSPDQRYVAFISELNGLIIVRLK